eukprot:99265_1
MSHSPAHSTHSNDPPIDTPSAHNKELPPHTIIHHDSIMHHSGSMSSLSSAASSYNTFCTNQRNEEEIFENVQSLSHLIHEPPSLSAAAISPSPKRVSPTSSPSQRHNNGNDSNSTHAHEPILSAISKLYTHNLSHASRSSSKEPELSASPCDDGLYLDSHHPQSDLPNQISINQHHDLKPNVSEQQDRECSPSTKERRTNNIIDSSVIIHCTHSDNSVSRSSMGTLGTLFNGIRTVNNYITREETQDPEEEEEKKEDETLHTNGTNDDNDRNQSAHSLHEIVSNPQFMDNAITMYGHLDNALTDLNRLKSHQLEQMKSIRRRKKRKRRKIYANISNSDDNDTTQDQEEEGMEEIDVNERVVFTMKTLISSTTQMGAFFASSDSKRSTFGVLFDKLSSSIAYMSYISVSTVTPFIYNLVEAVLLELYATIKDIIEYYDPDPKNNVLWRIIDKMNEIIEAIHGLLALSDCFYEICSDIEEGEEEEEEDQDPSDSEMDDNDKEKQD